MAESNAEPQQDSTSPAPQQAALADMVQGAIKQGLENLAKEVQAHQAKQAQSGEEPPKPEPKPDSIQEWLRPALEPTEKAVKQIEQRAAMVQDSVGFYTDAKNQDAFEFRDKIEDVVTNQARQGNIISRKDAWNWLRGGELYDTLQKRSLDATTLKMKEAQDAQTVGPSLQALKLAKSPEQMTSDELGSALKGISF